MGEYKLRSFTKRFSALLVFTLTVFSFQNCSMVGNPQAYNASSSAVSAQALLESKAFKVINGKCASCHNPNMPSGGIDYITDLDSLLYYRLVIPGEPQLSDLYSVIQTGKMPPNQPLSASEIKDVYDWIATGIVDQPSGVTPPADTSTTLEAKFASINKLILQPKCLGCHNSNKASGGVSFSTYAATMNTVQAGNPNSSSLYTSTNTGRMPQGGGRLTADQLTAIRTWITNGAQNN